MLNGGAVVRALAVAVAVANVACYNNFDDAEPFDVEDLTANITTEKLSTLFSSDEYYDVTEDLRVRGNVTAHDAGGNFYKSFVIESGGYGIEILEGLADSYVRHELGYEIVVQLNGLRLSRSRGVMQVGVAASAGSYYDVDYLGHEYLVNQHITNTGFCEVVEPREFTLSGLAGDSELATVLCGSLIRVTGLRYYSTDDDDDGTWSGTKCFVDATDPLIDGEAEATIWCYVTSYAEFAEADIPTTMGSITGILQGDDSEGGEGWEMLIKPRDIEDLDF